MTRGADLGGRRRRRVSHLAAGAALLLLGSLLPVLPAGAGPAAGGSPAGLAAAGSVAAPASTVPAGFADTVAVSGLTEPTDVAFASDGRVFISEKSGLIKVFDSLSDTTPGVFADLRTQVHNFWDRGLLGLTLDPAFPTKPYVYAVYTHDALPGGTAPHWGTAGATSDGCPNPPGATGDGCLVESRLSRLTASGDRMSGESVLVSGWCQQFPSHSIGTVRFGPDGALYAGGGDGASFNYTDYGQTKNPCGDPPSPAGTGLTAPTAQGGALRSQSVRRPAGQPSSLDGTIIRVDPQSGAAMPGNPFASSTDPNKRRIIAYGMRNPFRFAPRPGSQQLWVGDVGWTKWEEIDRIADVDDNVAENFGWPCYEGVGRQSGYDGANLDNCESLYSGAAPTAPFHTYHHDAKVVSGDACATGSSAISGVAFEDGSNYPADHDGALYFSDASRGCIWVMKRGGGADPAPTQISQFVGGAGQVVQLAVGPGGDLFYLDLGGGQLHRVVYTGSNHLPTAVVSADPTSGPQPLTVQFDGRGSTDLDGDPLSYAWDLDGDGAYDDATDPAPSRTYSSAGTVTARLRVTDPAGASDTAAVTIVVGQPDGPPVPVIDTPAGTLAWKVGDPISFSGHATDAEDGTLPASRLSWSVVINHCPSNCHTHPLQSFAGVASGSFPAPDHEYPASLTLTLTATDSAGGTGSTSVELDPRTVDLRFETSPTGLQVSAGAQTETAPITRTVIVGSSNSVSAPSPQMLGDTAYQFDSWSDGGAATHNIVAPAAAATYTARFLAPTPGCSATPSFHRTIPTPVGPPAATRVSGSRIAYAGLGSDGRYYLTEATLSGYPITSSPLLCAGGVATDSPAVAVGSSFAALFVRTGDNGVWQRTLTDASTGQWSRLPIGGASHTGPSAVVTGGDVVHLVLRGTNGNVYHATRRGTTWSAWQNLGGGVLGTPAVAPNPAGGIAIFVRGTDNGIYLKTGDTGRWTGWSRLSGATASSPTVAWGFSTGHLQLFVAGTTGGLYQRDFRNGAWGAWAKLDSTISPTARIAAAASTSRVIVYATEGGATKYKLYAGRWYSYTPAPYTCATCVPQAQITGTIP